MRVSGKTNFLLRVIPGVDGDEPREPLRGIISSKLAKFVILVDLLKKNALKALLNLSFNHFEKEKEKKIFTNEMKNKSIQLLQLKGKKVFLQNNFFPYNDNFPKKKKYFKFLCLKLFFFSLFHLHSY